jgi:hypothetical protein
MVRSSVLRFACCQTTCYQRLPVVAGARLKAVARDQQTPSAYAFGRDQCSRDEQRLDRWFAAAHDCAARTTFICSRDEQRLDRWFPIDSIHRPEARVAWYAEPWSESQTERRFCG